MVAIIVDTLYFLFYLLPHFKENLSRKIILFVILTGL